MSKNGYLSGRYQGKSTMQRIAMKKYIVRLSQEEKAQIEAILKKGRAAAYRIRHAHILLKADADGPDWSDEKIGRAFLIHPNTVGSIRKRYVEEGFEAALSRKARSRPPISPKFDGEAEARLIALRCSSPPEGFSRWTLRLLADKAVELEIVDSASYETVRRTLKKMNSSRTSSRPG